MEMATMKQKFVFPTLLNHSMSQNILHSEQGGSIEHDNMSINQKVRATV